MIVLRAIARANSHPITNNIFEGNHENSEQKVNDDRHNFNKINVRTPLKMLDKKFIKDCNVNLIDNYQKTVELL